MDSLTLHDFNYGDDIPFSESFVLKYCAKILDEPDNEKRLRVKFHSN